MGSEMCIRDREDAIALNEWNLCGVSGQIASYLAELNKIKDLYHVEKLINREKSINKILEEVKDFQWCSLSRTYAREVFAQRRRPLWFPSALKVHHIVHDEEMIADLLKEDYELMKSYVRIKLEYLIDILKGGVKK